MNGFGGKGLFFFSKLKKLQNISNNELSVIKMLYDHLLCYSFNFVKISNIYIKIYRFSPPKSFMQT
jgi:hypothetical protein